jgi:hypothetical protein
MVVVSSLTTVPHNTTTGNAAVDAYLFTYLLLYGIINYILNI